MAKNIKYIYDKEKGYSVPLKEDGYNNKSAWVRDDTIEPHLSDADGYSMFDSLSAYKKHLAELGFEITGGDHLTGRGMADYKADTPLEEIEETVARVVQLNEWGMYPLTEREKEICQQEQRRIERYKRDHHWKD